MLLNTLSIDTPAIALSPSLPLPLTVEEFLRQLKLQRYMNVFKDNGFEELDMLKYLDANALNKMQVLLGHQGKLLERMREIT
jgi:hypothetical protein